MSDRTIVHNARALATRATEATVGPILFAMLPALDALWTDAERDLAEAEEQGGALGQLLNLTSGGRHSDAITLARVFVSRVVVNP